MKELNELLRRQYRRYMNRMIYLEQALRWRVWL